MKHAWQLILSCEHATNIIPRAYQDYFKGARASLDSHEGWDIGAKALTESLGEALDVPSFYYPYSRLLIEVNRSVHHQRLWSSYSQNLTNKEKQTILESMYHPYREKVRDYIKKHPPVIHISVHSFTPKLNNQVRQAEIGLLYDPGNDLDARFCKTLKQALKIEAPHWRVRMNYPYKGVSDGFVTSLRQEFQHQPYIGIELETSQALWLAPEKECECSRIALVSAIAKSIQGF